MNLKTTLVLLLLVAAGAGVYYLDPSLPAKWRPGPSPPKTAAGTSLDVLENELTPDKLTRLEVTQGGRTLILERKDTQSDWGLPGGWPTRPAEVESLVALVGGLRSRFAALPLTDPAAYGLDKPAVTIKVKADDKEHTLTLAEKDDESSAGRFARPTYLRIDDLSEVVRLSPGVVAAFDKPLDYYQQRRLFRSERVAKEPGSQEKVERLAADAVNVVGPKDTGSYALRRAGDDWELSAPARDRVDPDKLKSVLAAVPDVWAEAFVAPPYKPLAEYGLATPEETVTVAYPGSPSTMARLLIGKVSPTVRERKVARATPPGLPPGMQLPPEIVKEEYRYAKLAANDQIFEIKADRLKDLFVAAKDLRDAKLARFKTEDVRKIEIKYAGQDVSLVKDKERWQVEKPIKADAETTKVTEVLDKVNAWQARDADVVDGADAAKANALDDPAKVGSIKVTLEEEKGEGEKKTKTTRTVEFQLGKHDADKKKLAVKVVGWDRVNLVEDAIVPLAKRPALAYRGRRVLDFLTGDVDSLKIERGGETTTIKSVKDTWKLEAPVAADADAVKAGGLATTLGGLEATEFVNDAPKPDELEKYGLAKGAVKATVTFTGESKKTPQTLLVGAARPDKAGEFYAKLEGGPSVFSVKKEVRDALDKPSLAYRPEQLWQLLSDDVTALRVQRAGEPEYKLAKKEGSWGISGPFDAAATPGLVEPMLTELAGPKAERYEAHDGKAKLKDYGLDAPPVKVVVTAAGKDRTLLVGKATEPNGKTRFAKTAEGDAVFVVADKLVSAVDKSALELLDRKLIAVDPKTVERVQIRAANAGLTLAKKGEAWEVVESPAGKPFAADRATVDNLLSAWSDLQAARYAAYGSTVDPAKFGLGATATTVAVTVQPPDKDGKKPPATTHTLALGDVSKEKGAPGDRYARLDNGPGVAVLPAFAAKDLVKGHLDFVDRTLVRADAAAATGIVRTAGPPLELRKKDGSWQVVKPQDARADDPTVENLIVQLASLRVKKVEAFPATDLKPFGLDAPAAVLTLDGPKPVTLKVGGAVPGTPADDPDRFVQVQGGEVVGVVAAPLAKLLVGDAIKFRDKKVAQFDDADRLTLERGGRKATFAKVDGTWKLLEPLEAEAEQADLDDFVNAAAKLRADELVAEKPADLKPFGLDKPEAKWVMQYGTTPKLTLLIGKSDKGRAFAKVDGKDVVFLLDTGTTSRVLGEFRKRTVWASSPDPAQVETLRYQRAQNPFALEKVDNVWRVQGKPDVKVDQAAVSETLATLDKLKAERFVADKATDLAQYRLAPPELTLEIVTPSGKKELHIGRTEGDSKRLYARVPEPNRNDVFVLSEADAAKVVRDVAGFAEKKAATPVKP